MKIYGCQIVLMPPAPPPPRPAPAAPLPPPLPSSPPYPLPHLPPPHASRLHHGHAGCCGAAASRHGIALALRSHRMRFHSRHAGCCGARLHRGHAGCWQWPGAAAAAMMSVRIGPTVDGGGGRWSAVTDGVVGVADGEGWGVGGGSGAARDEGCGGRGGRGTGAAAERGGAIAWVVT